MTKPKVLLTGDDGYNSLGTRILIHCLRDTYDLTVVGTATQQSAVGGRMSLATGFDWEHSQIEGIPAIVSHGTPVDAMELATDYFGTPHAFDLIISGINWGVNLGTTYSSGTVNAAIRGLMTRLAPQAIAMSWDLSSQHWTKNHTVEDSIEDFLPYPGRAVLPLLNLVQKENFWGAELININFPNSQSNKVMITQQTLDSTKVYKHPHMTADQKKGGHYNYISTLIENTGLSEEYDIAAVKAGWISITPCKLDFTDRQAYEKYQAFKTTITLS
jgi:5'-nucleotidase